MKSPRLPLLCLLVCGSLTSFAEEATIRQSVMLKGDRSLLSLKPGTVVEIVGRDGAKVIVRYKNVTGTIPAEKLDEPKVAEATPARNAPEPEKPKEIAPTPPSAARPPQSSYGKAVDKARDAVKQHDAARNPDAT